MGAGARRRDSYAATTQPRSRGRPSFHRAPDEKRDHAEPAEVIHGQPDFPGRGQDQHRLSVLAGLTVVFLLELQLQHAAGEENLDSIPPNWSRLAPRRGYHAGYHERRARAPRSDVRSLPPV